MTTPALRLFDLAGADPAHRFSPYCWRIRMALAHKGLACAPAADAMDAAAANPARESSAGGEPAVEIIPWRYFEKQAIARSGQGRVPVLVDGDQWIADSWAIACHLEDCYPDRPSLFGGGPAAAPSENDAARAYCRYFSLLADSHAAALFPLLARAVLDHVHADDRAYFRETREARLGMTLEAAQAGRAARVAHFRASLGPLRAVLDEQAFLGGGAPTYADHAIFGQFQWARSVGVTILEASDPVGQWMERMLDAFDGLARGAVIAGGARTG